jgi:hypothetical protein
MTATDRVGLAAPALAVLIVAGLLGGCTPSNPTNPAPSAASASPTASGGQSPSPSATSQADAAQAAIDSFIDRVTARGFSYTASLRGQAAGAGGVLPITGKVSVSGDNYALSATFRFPKQKLSIKVEQRYVRHRAWLRCTPCPSTAWHRVRSFGADDVLSPFAQVLVSSDVTYLGPVASGLGPRFRIRFDSMIIHPSLIPATNLSEVKIDRARLALVIDQNGRPITGAWELDGSGRVSGQLQEVLIQLNVKFANIGKRVTVRAP